EDTARRAVPRRPRHERTSAFLRSIALLSGSGRRNPISGVPGALVRCLTGVCVSTAPRAITPSVNGWNAEFLEAEYQRFRADPGSVPADLAAFFAGFELAEGRGGNADWGVRIAERGAGAVLPAPAAGSAGKFQSAVDNLIDAYRESGHMAARLDP